jgi:hypothetical protein
MFSINWSDPLYIYSRLISRLIVPQKPYFKLFFDHINNLVLCPWESNKEGNPKPKGKQSNQIGVFEGLEFSIIWSQNVVQSAANHDSWSGSH